MKLTSKIKTLLSEDALHDLAAICDTMIINSAQHKMLMIQQVLKREGIRWNTLGGATNRFTVSIGSIGGYTVKFALDHQGYTDNLIEYSLSRELQPYVPRTFETNGYILVADCWTPMTLSMFKTRRADIERVLSILAQDYLLGDVGFIDKNYTNWGVDDAGNVGILDYAYIHRATEKLFTCDVCGCGILRYDSTYSYLKCSNSASCTATFEYIDRKRYQGDQVDLDMIEEMKSISIKLPKGKMFKEVRDVDGELTSETKKIIYSADEYVKYMEEKNMLNETYDSTKALKLLAQAAKSENPDSIKNIEGQLKDLYTDALDNDEREDEEVVFEGDIYEEEEEEEDYGYEETDSDISLSLADLCKMAKNESVKLPEHETSTTEDESDDSCEDESSEADSNENCDDIDLALSPEQMMSLIRGETDKEVSTDEDDEEEETSVKETTPVEEPAETEVDSTEDDTNEDAPEEVKTPTEPIDVKKIEESMMQPSEDDHGVYLNGEKL